LQCWSLNRRSINLTFVHYLHYLWAKVPQPYPLHPSQGSRTRRPSSFP
jgi:hypothetical protein